MLAIDAVFLVLELGVGIAVGSLALLADAFHMVRMSGNGYKVVELTSSVKRYHFSCRGIMGCQSFAKVIDG